MDYRQAVQQFCSQYSSVFKTKTLNCISGRTMYDNASDVILFNNKKAMSLLPKLTPKVVHEDNSIVRFALGETEEDFLQYIRMVCAQY